LKAQINDIEISYRDEGLGTPVIFLHAFPLNQSMWDAQVEALRDHCRVITVDLRGHGESEAPFWFSSMEQFAGDVRALMDHLSIPKAVFVGLSLGGYVLFAFYRLYRERVFGLILSNTRPEADTQEKRQERFRMAQLAYRGGASTVADVMIRKLLCRDSITGRVDLVQKIRRMIEATPLQGIVGDLMGMALRAEAMLSEILCPTLVIVGKEDTLTTAQEAERMAGKIAGAHCLVIPSAGHLPNMEQEERFNAAVLEFIQSIK